MKRNPTQREINHLADLMVKADKYEALQMVRGKMPFPGTVRPKQTGWAALMTMAGK